MRLVDEDTDQSSSFEIIGEFLSGAAIIAAVFGACALAIYWVFVW